MFLNGSIYHDTFCGTYEDIASGGLYIVQFILTGPNLIIRFDGCVELLKTTFYFQTCFLRWGLQDFPLRIPQYAQDARGKNEEICLKVSLHAVDPLVNGFNPLFMLPFI